jgi:hypothetical protein
MGFWDFGEKRKNGGKWMAGGGSTAAWGWWGGGGKVFGWWDLDIREIGRRENTEEGGGAVRQGKKMGENGKKVT